MAQLCWSNYLRRNDSVVVDLFQGQYRSTIVCQKCSRVSVTFDPYMYLSVPLPPPDRPWRIMLVQQDPRELPMEVHNNAHARTHEQERLPLGHRTEPWCCRSRCLPAAGVAGWGHVGDGDLARH